MKRSKKILCIALALQEDGLLRMTLVNGAEEMVIYLAPAGPVPETESAG